MPEGPWPCPVCGYLLTSVPWTEPAYSYKSLAMFGICPCCGTQFGYTDTGGEGWPDELRRIHRGLRGKWVSAGMPWRSSVTEPPEDWNPAAQLDAAGLDYP